MKNKVKFIGNKKLNMTKQELSEAVDKFCEFIKELPINIEQLPPEFDYNNAVLILVDATLSINRRYREFVVPRIKLIKMKNIKTLEGLKRKIDDIGVQGFCELWKYNHTQRVNMLKELIEKFLRIKKELKLNNDLEALHEWGNQATIYDFEDFGVDGIGFITFQYLRLLCGANTVKPDRHIRRATEDGIGKDLSEADIVYIVEETAKKLNILAKQLDYALWNYYSQKAN